MVGYEIWEESARTYFMMSGHDKKLPEQAYAIFIGLLDLELRKMFKSGKTATMENMFSVLGDIFEAMYPLNTRRAKALQLKQGRKGWSSWIADYGSAWEEAKMSNLTMDQFKAVMAIGHTENLYIRDELLQIKGGRGEQEIRCYGCNARGHCLNKCHSDKTRMRCSDCGETADFKKSPHNTGAKMCPSNGGYGRRPRKSEEKKVRKVKTEEDDVSPSELTDVDDEGSDRSCDRAAEWVRCPVRYVSLVANNGP